MGIRAFRVIICSRDTSRDGQPQRVASTMNRPEDSGPPSIGDRGGMW